MPELPEIEALVDYLRREAVGLSVGRLDVAALSVLKPIYAFARPDSSRGRPVGKYLDCRRTQWC
ncbi:hypothetical protein DIJ64_00760 [Mycobacterium leprae]|uniref:Formamidopyrimidine-DNA glycosylase catalytic domain-containing protein n=1 Tax=Mycobacterium leprae TaxID=1769 RepID=A0AAD0P725_MYCLR|nr:hypothetical protein DIJ64_00760 [Mycobacterium leprae]